MKHQSTIDGCLAGLGFSVACFQEYLPMFIGIATFILILGRIIAVYYEIKARRKELREKDD